jgi:hypothetical protein
MPKLVIHMSQAACEQQQARVESVMSVRFREGGVEQARDVVLDLGWCKLAAHVITGVETVGEVA